METGVVVSIVDGGEAGDDATVVLCVDCFTFCVFALIAAGVSEWCRDEDIDLIFFCTFFGRSLCTGNVMDGRRWQSF